MLVVCWSMVWGLRGGIGPDSSPCRELHSTVSGAVEAAYQVSGRVLKQPMKPGFMAHFGGNWRSLDTLADCNKWRRRLYSNLDPFSAHPTRDPGLTKPLTPYSPRPLPIPTLCPAPLLHALPWNKACAERATPAGERGQGSRAMRGIPAAQPAREIHLCRPDSEGLFGAKHCAIKWR